MADPLEFNPFIDDKVIEPRQIEPSVPGLNDNQLALLLQDFKLLEQGAVPRKRCSLPYVRLVTSPDPGYGKSHLLGRLFERLGKRATLVNVRPFQVPESAWKALLRHTVQELQFQDRFATDNERDTPLQGVVFAHGVLSNLIVELLVLHKPQVRTNKFIQAMKSDPLAAYALSKRFTSWPKSIAPFIQEKEKLDQLLALLAQHVTLFSANPITWLRVLHAIGFRQEESALQVACMDWLKGESIEPEDAEALGVQRADWVPWDLNASERNELAKNRMIDLCTLAIFFRPFLFCFDQTETYGDSEALARALGQLTQAMWQELPNQMTVVTTNWNPWSKLIFPYWEDAAKQRLSSAKDLELNGLNLEQGRWLITNRMAGYKVDGGIMQRFLRDNWLGNLFRVQQQVRVRAFLIDCQRRWQEIHQSGAKMNDILSEQTLQELFATKVRETARSPHRVLYNVDVLLFAVKTVLSTAGGILEQKKGAYAVSWKSGKELLQVVLDPTSVWNHWSKLAKEANAQKNGRTLYLRTLEQPRIPGANWKVRPDIDKVVATGKMGIVVLSKEEHIRLHAAWNLYAEATGGDIPHSQEQVIQFLSAELATFRALLRPTPVVDTPKPPSPPPQPLPPPALDLMKQLHAIMSRAKLLKEEEVLQRLGIAVSQEQLHSAREQVPEIHIFCGPAMPVWQWVPRNKP